MTETQTCTMTLAEFCDASGCTIQPDTIYHAEIFIAGGPSYTGVYLRLDSGSWYFRPMDPFERLFVGYLIHDLMGVVGVERFDELEQKSVRRLVLDGKTCGFANIDTDHYFTLDKSRSSFGKFLSDHSLIIADRISVWTQFDEGD